MKKTETINEEITELKSELFNTRNDIREQTKILNLQVTYANDLRKRIEAKEHEVKTIDLLTSVNILN